jgi:hypothetical protein
MPKSRSQIRSNRKIVSIQRYTFPNVRVAPSIGESPISRNLIQGDCDEPARNFLMIETWKKENQANLKGVCLQLGVNRRVHNFSLCVAGS